MKKVKFKAKKLNGKEVKGYWFCAERPNKPQAIAERLCGCRLTNFISAVVEIKEHMIKVAENQEEENNG